MLRIYEVVTITSSIYMEYVRYSRRRPPSATECEGRLELTDCEIKHGFGRLVRPIYIYRLHVRYLPAYLTAVSHLKPEQTSPLA